VTDDNGSAQKVQNLWLPQFKLSMDRPEKDDSFSGISLNTQNDTIQGCFQQFQLELYGPPLSEGTLRLDFDRSSPDNFIVEKPFYVAVTHSAIEDLLEMPLIVAHISYKYWKV
jgi:hypothetical protein